MVFGCCRWAAGPKILAGKPSESATRIETAPREWPFAESCSRLPLPVDPHLAGALQQQHKRSLHTSPEDWVFANRAGGPRSQESILLWHLKPVAVRPGIGKIGWHTFRHSYSKMLRAAHVDLKVHQELLRHSTIQSTMNIYTQAVSEQKRATNSLVVAVVTSAQVVKQDRRGFEALPASGTQRVPIATGLQFRQSSASD